MASYRYERDIKPEDLVQEKPRELTPCRSPCELVALSLVLCRAHRGGGAGVGLFCMATRYYGRTGRYRDGGRPHRTGRSISERAGNQAGIPERGCQRRWKDQSRGQGRLARPAFERQRGLRRFAVFKWLKKLEKYAKPARTGSFRA